MLDIFFSRNGDMAAVSQDASGASRPKPGIVRERFDHEKDVVIEHFLGKAESWAKKVGTGQSGVLLDDIPALLEVLGLRAVDKEKVCVDRAVFQSFKAIAVAALTDSKKLEWDSD